MMLTLMGSRGKRQPVIQPGRSLTMSAQVINRTEDGFTVQITVPCNRSMLDFEETLQQQLNAAGVLATHEGLRQFDTDGSPITVGSMKLTSKGQLPKDYQRHGYR